ncbi:MAG TPA: hemerythrin domain-containing protein [Burkholderiaceae bacterium]|nr:hemerythrin domain-containing protein [Burkholderiaceae bacterium]
MPFAIMRNAHEALRASIRIQEQRLEAGDLAGFREEWQTFQRALAIHMAMEDNSMFALLDGISAGAISAAKLPEEHREDSRLAAVVDGTFKTGDRGALRAAWSEWKEDHLHHLSHEEEVMMPLTMKTAATPEARARVVHDRLLVPSESLPDFDWFIGWVVGMLSRHGSAAQPANVATRVFAWGLQHACSPDQWNRLRPIVERNCTPAIWAELSSRFGLSGNGPIV